MFRTYMVAGLFLVFLAIGGVTYSMVSTEVEQSARAEVKKRVEVARSTLERVQRLDDFAIMAKATQVARWPQIGQILSSRRESFADEEGNLPTGKDFQYQLHVKAREEVMVWDERFKALGDGRTKPSASLADWRRDRPDLFVVVDRQGYGIAHNKDPHWYIGRYAQAANLGKRFPAVLEAARGKPIQDIWIYDDAPMNVAVAPVRKDKEVLGAIVLGYRMTDQAAKRHKGLVGTEVAYFIGERLSKMSTIDAGAERELAAALTEQKLFEKPGDRKEAVTFQLGGETYYAFVGALRANNENAGFIVFGNLDRAVQEATSFVPLLTIFALVGFAITAFLVVLLFQKHLQPFAEIDRGILELINGDLDFWFDSEASEERKTSKAIADTMAQNLNILVCHLSGRPLPDEDDMPGAEWAEERLFFEDAGETAEAGVSADHLEGASLQVIQLVKEDQETYQRRTFMEYIDACRATGEAVQGISYQAFTQRLANNAAALRQQLGCQQVRFLVLIRDGRVALKPVPVA